MKKISLCKGNKRYDLNLNKYKIITGKYYSKKYDMMKIIREVFNGTISEFSECRKQYAKIMIDDIELNPKKNILFDLSQNFDLNLDLKMGSKSITLKYLETVLNDSVYFDSLNTISLLFKALEDEINQKQNDVRISFSEVNIKVLIKLASLVLILEDTQANMFDLSYEQMILLILKMIKRIIDNSTYEEIFIILDVPILTRSIYSFIETLVGYNILIFTNDYESALKIEDVFYCSRYLIDLSDENAIYSVFCEENNIVYELKEIKKMLNNYINKIEDEYTRPIKSILDY